MSDWLKVSGYLIVSPDLPNNFGKHHNDTFWYAEHMEDPHCWISRILNANQQNWQTTDHTIRYILPSTLHIRWEHRFKALTEDEIIFFTDEEKEKLLFPSGSEGPLDLSISSRLDPYYGLQYHVTFNGSLRNRSDLTMVIDWWTTIKKYLKITDGHIFASTATNYFEDSLHLEFGHDAKTSKVAVDLT